MLLKMGTIRKVVVHSIADPQVFSYNIWWSIFSYLFMTWFHPSFVFLLAVAVGTSIYVKHLPFNANIDMLGAEFKQFGAITNGGIQVINQRVRLTNQLTLSIGSLNPLFGDKETLILHNLLF